MEKNGCEWFIDQSSISHNSQSGIISYWALQKLSTLYRQQIIENYNYEKLNAREKRIAQQVTHLMIFQSINPKKQTFRNNEVIFFDERGTFLERVKFNEWNAIVPTSPVEYIFEWLKLYYPKIFR